MITLSDSFAKQIYQRLPEREKAFPYDVRLDLYFNPTSQIDTIYMSVKIGNKDFKEQCYSLNKTYNFWEHKYISRKIYETLTINTLDLKSNILAPYESFSDICLMLREPKEKLPLYLFHKQSTVRLLAKLICTQETQCS